VAQKQSIGAFPLGAYVSHEQIITGLFVNGSSFTIHGSPPIFELIWIKILLTTDLNALSKLIN
jgi:hypothetical protein